MRKNKQISLYKVGYRIRRDLDLKLETDNRTFMF